MNDNAGTQANLLRQFPLALQMDKQMQIMATVLAAALAKRWPEAELGILYPAIDQLPEAVLDILAYDLKVDWYDYGYSIEEKRRTLKDAWKVHRIKGTKAAVETAISAIYPNTTVEEWFEYEGGKPYHFRLRINISDDDVDSERMRRVLERLRYYKNLRSHNDGIHYFMEPETMTVYVWIGCPGLHETMETAVDVPALMPPAGEAKVDAATGVAGAKARMSAEIDMSAEAPHSETVIWAGAGSLGSKTIIAAYLDLSADIPHTEAETWTGARTIGANAVMAASLELHTEIPAGRSGVQAGAAAKGIKVCLEKELDLRRELPRSAVHTSASAGACGWSMGTEVVLDLRKTEYPGGTSAARAAGAAAGIYQKFVTGVSRNDTLE